MKKIKFINLLAITLISVMVFSCNDTQPTDIVTSGSNQESDVVTYIIGDVVPNSYIVEFNDNKKISDKIQSAASYAESKQITSIYAVEVFADNNINDFTIERAYSRSISGVNVILNEKDLALLRKNPKVKHIEQNRVISLGRSGTKGKPPKDPPTPPAQTTPYGITRVGSGDGTGKTCWIIDTGIDLDHPDLNVNSTLSKSFLTSTGKKNKSPDDQNGHGTHVAGTVAAIDNSIGVIGVAAGATVVAVRVLDRYGSGTYASVIAGVDWVAEHGEDGDVANMSLAGGQSTSINDAVIAASAKVKFAIAAGNDADHAENYSPASANGTNVFTVSAMNSSDNWASFSNYGNPPVDYCEPGVSIYSTWKGGGYNTISGTSMAAPHLAGILLLGAVSTDGTVSGDPSAPADLIGVVTP